MLCLGAGRDLETAKYISQQANKPVSAVLNTPLGEAWLLTRGEAARKVRKYDLKQHSLYGRLPEAAQSQSGYRASSRSCMAPTNALNPAGIPVIAAYIFSFMLLFLLSCWAQGCPGAYNAGAMPAVSFWCRFKAPLFSACAASGSRP